MTFLLPYIIIDRPGNHIHADLWRGRCTYCGHRVAHKFLPGWSGRCKRCRGREHSYQPTETRKQPWRIPSEIVHRYLAMRRGV